MVWYYQNSKEIIAAQQYLKPAHEFRTKFGYSNIAFLAAGQIIEKITGKSWSDYVTHNFTQPLQMNRTLTSISQIPTTTNVATPYYFENGKNQELKWLNWDNIAPAGAFISSANDFALWLKLNINEGTINNKTYFSNQSFTELTTPHVNFKVGNNSEKVHFKSYGLGWSLQDYQGYKVVSHGGGYDGMISKSFFIPEKKIGVIILTNSLNWVPSALTNKILDVLLANNLNGKDWSSTYLSYKNQQDSVALSKHDKNEMLRGKLNKTHLELQKYAGTYKDKMYGMVTISIKNGKLHFSMDETPIFYAD